MLKMKDVQTLLHFAKSGFCLGLWLGGALTEVWEGQTDDLGSAVSRLLECGPQASGRGWRAHR